MALIPVVRATSLPYLEVVGDSAVSSITLSSIDTISLPTVSANLT